MKLRQFLIWIFLLSIPLVLSAQSRNVNEKRKVKADVNLSISNVSGKIDVIAWDKNEVLVEGELEEDVEELDISGDENRLKIKVEIPKHGHNRHASAYLTIHVPVKSLLYVTGVSADVFVKGTEGETLEAESVSGRVDVQANADDMECKSVSGRVKVSGKGGSLKASTVSGSVMISGTFTNVEAGSVSGEIEAEVEKIENGDFGTTSGSIDFTAGITGRGRFGFKSVSGSIDLNLDKNISADFDISTFSGGINNRLTGDRPDKKEYGSGRDLEFTAGKGDVRIKASSFSGSVDVSAR